MSKEFFQAFFPSLASLVSSPELAPSFVVGAWEAIFPDDASVLCRLPRSHAHSPQRPCLALAALVGACLGLRKDTRTRRTPSRDEDAAAIWAAATRASLSTGLVSFGAMNVVALVHHCLLPPRASYPHAHGVRERVDHILWGADCLFTGVSATNLVVVAWLLYGSGMVEHGAKDATALTRAIGRLRLAVHCSLFAGAATLPVVAQWLYYGKVDLWAAGLTGVELVYLLPLAAAAACLLPLVVASAFFGRGGKRSTVGARRALLGAALIVASLPSDASLCYFVASRVPGVQRSPLLNDVYHLPTLVFVGCDAAMFGVGIWVRAMIRELSGQNKKDP